MMFVRLSMKSSDQTVNWVIRFVHCYLFQLKIIYNHVQLRLHSLCDRFVMSIDFTLQDIHLAGKFETLHSLIFLHSLISKKKKKKRGTAVEFALTTQSDERLLSCLAVSFFMFEYLSLSLFFL